MVGCQQSTIVDDNQLQPVFFFFLALDIFMKVIDNFILKMLIRVSYRLISITQDICLKQCT